MWVVSSKKSSRESLWDQEKQIVRLRQNFVEMEREEENLRYTHSIDAQMVCIHVFKILFVLYWETLYMISAYFCELLALQMD